MGGREVRSRAAAGVLVRQMKIVHANETRVELYIPTFSRVSAFIAATKARAQQRRRAPARKTKMSRMSGGGSVEGRFVRREKKKIATTHTRLFFFFSSWASFCELFCMVCSHPHHSASSNHACPPSAAAAQHDGGQHSEGKGMVPGHRVHLRGGGDSDVGLHVRRWVDSCALVSHSHHSLSHHAFESPTFDKKKKKKEKNHRA